ncbi:MAG: AraC family transcriptional regulator ligand-binding domain-containing protein [Pseudomonadota bacterium]
MSARTRYPLAKKAVQLCSVLKISHERVFRRAGLSPDFDKHENGGVDAHQYYAIWEAVVAEAKRPDLALFLGEVYARGPFIPAVFAFSCSPTVAIGLERLALFKPLLGPIRLLIERTEESISIRFVSSDPTAEIPHSMAPFEIVYFLELSRNFTTEHIVPLKVEMPGNPECLAELERHAGITFTPADHCRLVLSMEDANLPLISENEDLWADFEQNLRRQLAERDEQTKMSIRVKNVLLEMLPSGLSSSEIACQRLGVSKRSLQRALQTEGASFQGILDATRSELSLHYLTKEELSVEEISYLLAYRDPNSFYRAFHGWTGMTPAEARSHRAH